MPQSNPDKPILAVLLGDATGIGPELVAKIAADGSLHAECRPLLLGDRRVLAAGMMVAGVEFPVRAVTAAAEADFTCPGVSILDTADNDPAAAAVGTVDPACGKACGDACRRAADMWRRGEIDGIVFAPFNKAAMKQGGYNYESEHQLFGEYLAVKTPYGGEQGLCGREEIDVIGPAIERARAEGIAAAGPFPSDTVFVRAFKGDFDAVVTMYHDQGQIALKVKGFESGVTLAGGQPFPIATPAHGTAHDIAGKNRANTGAIKAAVRLAARMARNQKLSGTAEMPGTSGTGGRPDA